MRFGGQDELAKRGGQGCQAEIRDPGPCSDARASRRVGASMRAIAAGCDIASAGSAGDVGNVEQPPRARKRAQNPGAAAGSKPAAAGVPQAVSHATARGCHGPGNLRDRAFQCRPSSRLRLLPFVTGVTV